MRTTPALLLRTVLYVLLVQAVAVLLIASVVPRGAAWLTVIGFVTAWYDNNVLAVKLTPVPWTDPTVYVSLQTLLQMLAVAMAVAAVITWARTNPWEHGALADSAASALPKDKGPRSPRSLPVPGSASEVAASAEPGAPAPAALPAAPAPAPAAQALAPTPRSGT